MKTTTCPARLHSQAEKAIRQGRTPENLRWRIEASQHAGDLCTYFNGTWINLPDARVLLAEMETLQQIKTR